MGLILPECKSPIRTLGGVTERHRLDGERFHCECCGAMGSGVAEVLMFKGTYLTDLWECDRCHAMPLVMKMAAAIHFYREGRPMPQLIDWLSEEKEPQVEPFRTLSERITAVP